MPNSRGYDIDMQLQMNFNFETKELEDIQLTIRDNDKVVNISVEDVNYAENNGTIHAISFSLPNKYRSVTLNES